MRRTNATAPTADRAATPSASRARFALRPLTRSGTPQRPGNYRGGGSSLAGQDQHSPGMAVRAPPAGVIIGDHVGRTHDRLPVQHRPTSDLVAGAQVNGCAAPGAADGALSMLRRRTVRGALRPGAGPLRLRPASRPALPLPGGVGGASSSAAMRCQRRSHTAFHTHHHPSDHDDAPGGAGQACPAR